MMENSNRDVPPGTTRKEYNQITMNWYVNELYESMEYPLTGITLIPEFSCKEILESNYRKLFHWLNAEIRKKAYTRFNQTIKTIELTEFAEIPYRKHYKDGNPIVEYKDWWHIHATIDMYYPDKTEKEIKKFIREKWRTLNGNRGYVFFSNKPHHIENPEAYTQYSCKKETKQYATLIENQPSV
jgi:hypothetical protein